MVATLNHMQFVRSAHFGSHLFEEIQRTKRIACPLNEENRCIDFAQHFVAQFCRIAAAAQGITETNQARDFFLKGNVTSDPPAHAFADQEKRTALRAARLLHGGAMRCDENSRRIWALAAFAHVAVVEGLDGAERLQELSPM